MSQDNHNTIKQAELLVICNRSETAAGIRLELMGRMTANGIGELRREIEEARRRRKTIRLDMTEVTLLDRVSAEFLNSVAGPCVVFENCPVYLQPWIGGKRTFTQGT